MSTYAAILVLPFLILDVGSFVMVLTAPCGNSSLIQTQAHCRDSKLITPEIITFVPGKKTVN